MPSYPPSFALAVYLIRSFIRRSWDGRKPRRWLLCRSSDRTPEAISSWVRSTRHVLTLVDELEAKGAALTVLEPAFSTKDAAGPIHVTVLGMGAEMERKFIRERQQVGIEAAKAKGVYKGRKPSAPVEKVREMRASGHGPTAIVGTLISITRPAAATRGG